VAKNVVIFSDGTGQAGGFRFDEVRSNIYKLYRATRCGPDSAVDPNEQIAFYDPGLGSQADGGHLAGRFARWVYDLVSRATGFGITANIIDCYAALIRLWDPGDRVFLIGFSRGAYTTRCLAGVIALCGIPTRMRGGNELRLDTSATHSLATYAVKHVYQFTSSRSYADTTSYQKFLLDTRSLLGKRFREDCGSAEGDKANTYPYFIGVFDTVAALGSFRKFFLFALLFLGAAALVALLGDYLSLLPPAPLIGGLLEQLSFARVFLTIVAAAITLLVAVFIDTHIKWDFSVPGYSRAQNLRTLHFTDIWQTFYDYDLNENVGYARHAISIDENRKDFVRVPWGYKDAKHEGRDSQGHLWFEQVWFAGNHSDIGGSYPENESRLSDISLQWMVQAASRIPNGLKYDPNVLKLWPAPEGMQHDEVKAGFGLLTKLFGVTWGRAHRKLPGPKAVVHRSVYERFDQREVQVYERMEAYRPETLRDHIDFAHYYNEGAPFPATSARNATAAAED
jgi:uncharacterized protein (DUF2235 family)